MNRELLKKNFEKHLFATSFFDTKEEAADYLCSQIRNTTVGFGGSMTLTAMNLYDRLTGAGNTVYSHSVSMDPHCMQKARDSEFYVCSANGVSETGEMVNIDGRGNRVSATLFGPKKVFFVVGRNKIVPSLAEALTRAKTAAAPPNAARLKKKTPCAAEGKKCFDCNSPERICNATVIYERAMTGMEAEVVFIDEDLGF